MSQCVPKVYLHLFRKLNLFMSFLRGTFHLDQSAKFMLSFFEWGPEIACSISTEFYGNQDAEPLRRVINRAQQMFFIILQGKPTNYINTYILVGFRVFNVGLFALPQENI